MTIRNIVALCGRHGRPPETTLELSPGKHTLQLIRGDKNHIPHEPPVMSNPITIHVK